MANRTVRISLGLTSLSAGLVWLSFIQGQERQLDPSPTLPRSGQAPVAEQASLAVPKRNLDKLSPLQQQMYLSARRGSDWLRRANRPDGRFVSGYIPALKTLVPGDHYLSQAGAALALARAARFFGDDRSIALARQAVLTLLVDTSTDPKEPHIRYTTLSGLMVNRLGAAGLLVAAIYELPVPGDDLLEQSEQLCGFIRKQQRSDGSLSYNEGDGEAEPEGVNSYPGLALYGLMRSQSLRPAAWKLEVVRKALPYYQTWWQGHKSMSFVPWQTAAYSQAYVLTKEKVFGEFVVEMTDWLCDLQYVELDPRHPLWAGGFMDWVDGKMSGTPPQASSAVYAQALSDALQAARQLGDVKRTERYRDALERSLQFLTTLQYTDANTQHFADWYRPALLGAFYTSHLDGNLRLDNTQHAVSALVQYLNGNCEW